MKKSLKEIRRVGIIANSDKPSSRKLILRAIRLIEASGRSVLLDAATAELARVDSPAFPKADSLARQVDLILVFGGDGTMLRAARDIGGSRTPLLGVNVGRLGFLTDISANDLEARLRQVWNHEFTLEPRALMEASGRSQDRVIHACALNDFVVGRAFVSRLIELDVSVDGELLTRYRCDGFIVSSPTGSTAYSLAAGGAVVFPTAEVFTLTPICPHTLSNRSVIVSLSSTIQVKVVSQKPEIILSADGRGESELHTGDSVSISRSKHSVYLVRLQGSSFFETLRLKLNWSGSNVRPK